MFDPTASNGCGLCYRRAFSAGAADPAAIFTAHLALIAIRAGVFPEGLRRFAGHENAARYVFGRLESHC